MKTEELNNLPRTELKKQLFRCCSCHKWVEELAQSFPFHSGEDLKLTSDKIWFGLSEDEMLEAFSHHPKIGEKKEEDKWASEEQSGIGGADKHTLDSLANANEEYLNKFGFIFIVCATGKTAGETLKMIKDRLQNDRPKELQVAAIEQNKITHIRLDKLLS